MTRWTATITYRIDGGFAHMRHDLDELHDLDEIVERGPHWDTIDQIHIVRAGLIIPALTVEGAMKL